MHFSKILFTALAATAAASFIDTELNSTELAAVLANVGPVIIQTVTVTEHLAVIPPKTPRSRWFNVPFRLIWIPTSSTSSGKPVVPRPHLHPTSEMTGTGIHTGHTRLGLFYKHRFTRHGSSTLASPTSVSQSVTTSELPKATEIAERNFAEAQAVESVSDAKLVVSTQTLSPI